MAYIIGITTARERTILRDRGWVIEDAPKELVAAIARPSADTAEYSMVFVDRSMFDVMDGPDWDKSTDET